MTRNTLNDLNNHLFEEMERLNDESLNYANLQKEIQRSGAMAEVGDKIIKNASVILKAQVAYGNVDSADPKDKSELLLGHKPHEVHKTTD